MSMVATHEGEGRGRGRSNTCCVLVLNNSPCLAPEPRGDPLGLLQRQALDDAAHVAQVEGVVALGGRRQQLGDGRLAGPSLSTIPSSTYATLRHQAR